MGRTLNALIWTLALCAKNYPADYLLGYDTSLNKVQKSLLLHPPFCSLEYMTNPKQPLMKRFEEVGIQATWHM